MATRLRKAKNGLCLRCVAPRGKGIEASVIANGSQLFQYLVELLGLHGRSAPLGQRQDPDCHDLAAAPKREDVARLDRVSRLFDPYPVEAHPAGLGGRLGQRPRAVEAGVEQPFVQPGFAHRVRRAARPANGEFGFTGVSGRFSLRGWRALSLDRRHTGLAPSTSISRQPSAASTARASSLPLPRSETILFSKLSASLPLAVPVPVRPPVAPACRSGWRGRRRRQSPPA